MAAIDWVWELVGSARNATEKALLEITSTRLVEHSEQLICEVTGGAHGAIQLPEEPTRIVHGTTNFVHGFLFGCVSIGLTISNEHFIGICGKGGFFVEDLRKDSSSQKELSSFLHETEETSLGAWISLDVDVLGVPSCGSLDICFHLGYGDCCEVADPVIVREAGDVVMYDSEVALLCYPFAYYM